MTTPRHRHRPDRGNASFRLDPYVIDEMTITLEGYRRRDVEPSPPTRTRPGRGSRRPVARRTAATA